MPRLTPQPRTPQPSSPCLAACPLARPPLPLRGSSGTAGLHLLGTSRLRFVNCVEPGPAAPGALHLVLPAQLELAPPASSSAPGRRFAEARACSTIAAFCCVTFPACCTVSSPADACDSLRAAVTRPQRAHLLHRATTSSTSFPPAPPAGARCQPFATESPIKPLISFAAAPSAAQAAHLLATRESASLLAGTAASTRHWSARCWSNAIRRSADMSRIFFEDRNSLIVRPLAHRCPLLRHPEAVSPVRSPSSRSRRSGPLAFISPSRAVSRG